MPEDKRPLVAIIDDHASVVEMMAFALGGELPEFRFAEVKDIGNAVARITELSPAIGVIDWRMGTTTGAQIIEAVKARLPNTRWILFTAHVKPAALKEALEAGVCGCVSKGMSFREVALAIRAAHAGEEYYCKETSRTLATMLQAEGPKDLSAVESHILRLIARGLEAQQIAEELCLTPVTTSHYLAELRRKTGRASYVHLRDYAVESGLVQTAD